MRPEEMSPVVEVGFYLYGIGMVDGEAPLQMVGAFPSGVYAFTIDGFPVNSDGEGEDGEPNWMFEELSMSLQLLESMTGWVKGNHAGAGCFCDYVEFHILALPDGEAELDSHYAIEPRGTRKARCKVVDLFAGFDKATRDWEGYYTRLKPLMEEQIARHPVPKDYRYLKEMLGKGFWEQAFAAWRAAYAGFGG